MLAQTGRYDQADDVAAICDRLAAGDEAAIAKLLHAGLARRVWRGDPADEEAAVYRLLGGDLRIYNALRDVDARSGPGAYVCEGDVARPGCHLVFWSARAARWCRTCRHNRRPPTRELRRPVDRWDPHDTRELVGRLCAHCGDGFWTLDTKQLYCGGGCRTAACRAA